MKNLTCFSSARALLMLSALVLGNGCFSINVPENSKQEKQVLTPSPQVSGPAWWGFGRDAQHSATSAIATQSLVRIRWSSAVDLEPVYVNTHLLIHYGSPVVTSMNTVIVPVKTTREGAFAIEARAGGNGVVLWSTLTDYVPVKTSWMPSYNIALTSNNRLYAPGAGGKLIVRDNADSATGSFQSIVFYGSSVYDAAKTTFDTNVIINTPLTVDAQGNVFFGFVVNGPNPAGLKSGIARVGSDGVGAWVSASAATGQESITQVALNCAPAMSADSKIVYVGMNTSPQTNPTVRQNGYLVALDSTTLATIKAVPLKDPKTGDPVWISDSGTASPTVGPDGDVYYGVLESNAPAHNFRGWLLHFNQDLSEIKTPGSFGWDITASVLPASMVPSYTGSSTYLLMTKYNNYASTNSTGDGKNRVAILDPHESQSDAIAAVPVMKEVLTILGPTADPEHAGGVQEWCINTVAVDPFTKSVLVNNEDGYLYRWDLATNSLIERIMLSSGVGEAYTPTAIGADGAVYAINNAVLFSIGL